MSMLLQIILEIHVGFDAINVPANYSRNDLLLLVATHYSYGARVRKIAVHYRPS